MVDVFFFPTIQPPHLRERPARRMFEKVGFTVRERSLKSGKAKKEGQQRAAGDRDSDLLPTWR